MAKKQTGVETIVSINEMVPDAANVRVHNDRNKAAILASLKRFGPWRSIAVTADNRVVAGNGTIEAAAAAGIDEVLIVEPKPNQIVAVKRSDLSNTEATAYSIADNRTAELAEWDQPGLIELLQSLRSEDFDTKSLGFSDDEIDKLIKKMGDQIIDEAGMNETIAEKLELVVSCANEQEQQQLYDELTKRGLTCRVLTF